jgi:TetR/AcrR family transcriptional repressor of nem operon
MTASALPQPDDDRQDTKKRILDMAEDLLLTRGFNAFSYQHISSELGMKNAAIHYHYPKKTTWAWR